MASKTLSPDGFGQRLYGLFPPSYREEDALVGHALRRYLEAAADGGFAHIIREQNGLLDLVDPQRTTTEGIYLLYEQYGLPLFHGVPEPFLRALLSDLGIPWQRKGSLNVLEAVVSALAGTRASARVEYDEQGIPDVDVRVEMDYAASGWFPDEEQMERIVERFLPFYCGFSILYAYVYYEDGDVLGEEYFRDLATLLQCEEGRVPNSRHWSHRLLNVPDRVLNGSFLLSPRGGAGEDYDYSWDLLSWAQGELGGVGDLSSWRDLFKTPYSDSPRVLPSEDSRGAWGESSEEGGGILPEEGPKDLLSPAPCEESARAGDIMDFDSSAPYEHLNNPRVLLNRNFILGGVGKYREGVRHLVAESRGASGGDDLLSGGVSLAAEADPASLLPEEGPKDSLACAPLGEAAGAGCRESPRDEARTRGALNVDFVLNGTPLGDGALRAYVLAW